MHLMELAFSLAEDSAGSSIAARIAIMAITTSNSIKVKAKPRTPERGKRVLIELKTSSDGGVCAIAQSAYQSL